MKPGRPFWTERDARRIQFIREMLLANSYSTVEILDMTLDHWPEWTASKAKEGRDLEGCREKCIMNIHEICKQMRKEGYTCGYKPRHGQGRGTISPHRIAEWFMSTHNVLSLNTEQIEIIKNGLGII